MNPPPIQVGVAVAIMEGGVPAVSPYEPGTVITYGCGVGWKLVGDDTSMCDPATLEWSLMGANVPQCLQGKIECNFAKF